MILMNRQKKTRQILRALFLAALLCKAPADGFAATLDSRPQSEAEGRGANTVVVEESRSRGGPYEVVAVREDKRAQESRGGGFRVAGAVLKSAGAASIFSDGFESGNTSNWSNTVPTVFEVPSGAVAFFLRGYCPTGWSDFVSARGRAIVGKLAGGTLGGAVGQAITDFGLPRHQHSFVESLTTTDAGSHHHGWATLNWYNDWVSYNSAAEIIYLIQWNNGIDDSGAGNYLFSAGTSSLHYTDVKPPHNHSVRWMDYVSEAGWASLPYVELRVCRSN
jgi:hypothetical protein